MTAFRRAARRGGSHHTDVARELLLDRLHELWNHQVADDPEAELARTEAALERAARGAFGICQECEQPISMTRLAVLPATELCTACALQKYGTPPPAFKSKRKLP